MVWASPLAQSWLTRHCSSTPGPQKWKLCSQRASEAGLSGAGARQVETGQNPPDTLCVPLQKWQRRFFILYEHGLLRYALDEMVSVLLRPSPLLPRPSPGPFVAVVSACGSCVLLLRLLLGRLEMWKPVWQLVAAALTAPTFASRRLQWPRVRVTVREEVTSVQGGRSAWLERSGGGCGPAGAGAAALGGRVPADPRGSVRSAGLLSGPLLELVSLIVFDVQRSPGHRVSVLVTEPGCTGSILSCHPPDLFPGLDEYLPTR